MFYIFNRYLSAEILFAWLLEAMLMFSFSLLTVALRFGFNINDIAQYDPHFVKTAALIAPYIIIFYYFDLYSSELYYPGRQMILKLFQATAVVSIVLFSIYFLFPLLKAWRGIFILNTLTLPLLVLIWRTLLIKWLNIKLPQKRVLIMGTGEMAKKIGAEVYREFADHGLQLVGFIDDDPAKFGQSIVNPGVIGGYGDIERIVMSEKIDRIIIALPDRRAKLPMSALLNCKMHGVSIEEGETFKERLSGKILLDHLKPSWMVFSDGFKSLRSRKILKRIIDIFSSLLWLILAFPIFILTALLIKLESEGPVIFKQKRVGETGKEFYIYKFRSMRQNAEKATGPVWAGTNDDRVTRVGKVIRKLRIDEIPQLFNVLKGDMSFVGPRPERAYFVNKLKEQIPYYEMRTLVKPGITGWAQIKYPYGATVQDAIEKLQYDLYYIKNISPFLDIMIIFWTIKVVLTGKGAR